MPVDLHYFRKGVIIVYDHGGEAVPPSSSPPTLPVVLVLSFLFALCENKYVPPVLAESPSPSVRTSSFTSPHAKSQTSSDPQ